MPPWTSPPWLGVTLLSMASALVALIGYQAFKFRRLRKRLDSVCVRLETMSTLTEHNSELATGILHTIKGWAVVTIEKEKTRVAEVENLIKPIPEAAAQKVMEKLDERQQNGHSHDSGTIPIVRPPE